MKIYVVYYVTMEDSPSWAVVCVTTDKAIAEENFNEAKAWENEFMEDHDEDSGDWAEARLEEFEKGDGKVKPGDLVNVVAETEWLEGVETSVKPFLFEDFARDYVKVRKAKALEDYPGLVPFDDETFDKAMHLHDDSVMVDFYFDIRQVEVQ